MLMYRKRRTVDRNRCVIILELIDKASNKIYQKGIINSQIKSVITGGKDIILNNVTSNIKNEMNFQERSIHNIGKYVDNFNEYLKNKDFDGMTKEWKKIQNNLKSIIPLENILKQVRQTENIYNLIKNNADTKTVIDYKVRSGVSGTNGIYTTTATNGNVPVYYYRGAADKVNNNIIFNNMCWKIIRTTENNGIKLIYNGTPTDGKCETQTGEAAQIGTSKFNETSNDNAYVGYMYGTAGSDNYEATHANVNDSTIKKYIDNWYSQNFDESATSKLEDTVFCNDRSTKAYDANTIGDTSYSSYGDLGYGKNNTFYGAAHRASYYSNNPNPSLVCQNNNDKFTVDSKNGNGALTYPVGLITLDEVVLAGFNTYYSNENDYEDTTNYLCTNNFYWTFSPVLTNGVGSAYVGRVFSTGSVSDVRVNYTHGVRPVVSLADSTLVNSNGEGTSTNPYVVK